MAYLFLILKFLLSFVETKGIIFEIIIFLGQIDKERKYFYTEQQVNEANVYGDCHFCHLNDIHRNKNYTPE